MSGRNTDLVRELYRAAGERDLERVLDFFDEDVELDVTAVAADQGIYRGREGIRDYFEEVWDVAATFAFEVEDAVEVDDRVVVTLGVRVVGASSGAEYMQTYGAVWRIVDGRAAEIRLYPDPTQARRAAEL
jgi:ketosteroid isomerase-like protein